MVKVKESNKQYKESQLFNNETEEDFYYRLRKIALSMFEWYNLPESMDSRFIELCLFEDGKCAFLYDELYGFINTRCATSGNLNIYGLPTELNCFSFSYSQRRNVYNGLKDTLEDNDCILVKNNYDFIPTHSSLMLFSKRLSDSERVCDVNINAQKTPVLIAVEESQRLMMVNLYNKYDGNEPFIFGDKNQLSPDSIRCIKTDAPYVADKIKMYQKEIWNDALTFLGINNIQTEKKERLITDEASSNNELINLNLQSFLAPRQEACKQFNDRYGTNIGVRVRSDLHNIIKNAESVVNDYANTIIDNNIKDEIGDLNE